MISIFFHDLANTIKTLPISAGLNSNASNGQDPHMMCHTWTTHAEQTQKTQSVRFAFRIAKDRFLCNFMMLLILCFFI
jgi:hypothetical protein